MGPKEIRQDVADLKPKGSLPTAKEQYDENTAAVGVDPDPVERLRLFCSYATHGVDWLDLEPFFEDILKERELLQGNP